MVVILRLQCYFILATLTAATSFPVNLCFNKTTAAIPKNHLFWKKEKPLIIGHRGRPKLYQENTIEGVKSLLETKADGFEIDIYLTKDQELVVFHDDNTEKLTGEDHMIWNLTLAEIRNLRIKKVLQYGNYTYTFSDHLSIPTLEELLMAVKDTNMFMYLEMKPSHNPRHDARDTQRSIDTGRAVAKLVTKLRLESKAFLVSFDPVKPWAAKQENPDLVVGTFFEIDDWRKTAGEYALLRQQYQMQLPNLKCLENVPASRQLAEFLHESGSIFKAMNASFVDMEYQLYNNAKYSNDTFAMLRAHYRSDVSAGGWTFLNMKMSKKELDESEAVIRSLVSQGIERLITDDVPRMRELLGRKSSSNKLTPDLVMFTILLLLNSMVILRLQK